MIKGLSNIIKEDKKIRAIDKLLGCTCDKRKEMGVILLQNSMYMPWRNEWKKCPIHGWKRRQ